MSPDNNPPGRSGPAHVRDNKMKLLLQGAGVVVCSYHSLIQRWVLKENKAVPLQYDISFLLFL